jgi:1-acyl-sn-glycerol-3-phosphate acyltransferase
MQFTERLFASLVVVTTYILAPAVLVLTGQHYDLNDKSFAPLICNHQLFTDWLYFWLVGWFRSSHGNLKIMAKQELRKLPIFGFLGFNFDFIFLARKWKLDRERIISNLFRAKKDNRPMWLLLFPEGTTHTPEALEKTLQYGEKMGWKGKPKRVLFPKSTGLFHSIRAIQDRAEYLYDFTMAFEGLDPSKNSAWEFYSFGKIYFEGNGPKSVHLHCERIKLTEIPGIVAGKEYDPEEQTPAEFDEWLRGQFMLKDELMEEFAREGKFASKIHADDGLKQLYHVGPEVMDWISVLGVVIASFSSISFAIF